MSTPSALPFVTADDIHRSVSYAQAVDALEDVLRSRSATDHTPLRTRTDFPHGHLLYMPAQVGDYVGTKIASVAPDNAERGLPRIQGLVILADSTTLQPRVVLDASGFTVLRTAALSALAVRHLAPEGASRLVVFGAGPQAWGHVEAIRAVRPLDQVVVVGRSAGPAAELVSRVRALGVPAEVGTPEAVADADIVACCTSATTPLFDSALLGDTATVVAMGSHSPRAREVDTALVRRAVVVVESRASAFAEAGDIILACQDGAPEAAAVDREIADIVREPLTDSARPRLFKGVGEAWSDVAVAAYAAHQLGVLTPGRASAPSGAVEPAPLTPTKEPS